MSLLFCSFSPDLRSHEVVQGTWLTRLGLTITFEFLLGYFVLGLTLESMLSEYNILEGRFEMLVLLSILIGPKLYFKLGEHGAVGSWREKLSQDDKN